MPMSIEVSAFRADGPDAIATCNGDVASAEGFAVYVRNPTALHLQDFPIHFTVAPARPGVVLAASRKAFDYADMMAEHLGCEVDSQLTRVAVVPQRDMLLDPPSSGFGLDSDDAGTCFEECPEEQATQWALFQTGLGCASGSDLVEDYPTRAAAEAAGYALMIGEALPDPVWPAKPGDVPALLRDALAFVEGFEGDDAQQGVDALIKRLRNATAAPRLPISKGSLAATAAPSAVQPLAQPGDSMPAELRAWLLDEMEARIVKTGGGCEAVRHDGPGGAYVFITGSDGGCLPDWDSWLVGAYSGKDGCPGLATWCSLDVAGQPVPDADLREAVAKACELVDGEGLALRYVDAIGYNPFTDDPTISPDTVRQTLRQHKASGEREFEATVRLRLFGSTYEATSDAIRQMLGELVMGDGGLIDWEYAGPAGQPKEQPTN